MQQTPYIPGSRRELRFANRISTARLAGRYGLLAFWGGIALAVSGSVLELEAAAVLTLAGLAETAAVCLITTSFILHVTSSFQAVQMKRLFPHNPLPAKFVHAELVRWLHRIDLILTIAATIAATLVLLGVGAVVTIPSGIGLGFLGWIVATIWGLGANRAVYKEVARQKKLAHMQIQELRTSRAR